MRPSFDECHWYHTVDLPDRGVVGGAWDLRGREDRYTGNVDFRGKQVLEIGPASGGLTAYMERQGASILCFETSEDPGIDILPSAKENLAAHKEASNIVLRQVKNAWQYSKHALGLRAGLRCGDINTMPGFLGPVDIAMLGAVLVHCKSPPDVVRQVCLAASEAVIVTDLLTLGLESEEDSLMRFNPSQGTSLIYWWGISPGAVINMLALHGFPHCAVTYHEQMHRPAGDMTLPLAPAKMFTVVGRK